jgi:hypothetical protein
MHAHPDAFPVDDGSSREHLELATGILAGEAGAVLFERTLALRPARHSIRCEVLDDPHGAHRCAEEYKVLVENAARRLASSCLAPFLPHKRLTWVVVVDSGEGVVEVWPGTQEPSHGRP